jgi:alpha-beta hydrolase superfamily lysophospholipase
VRHAGRTVAGAAIGIGALAGLATLTTAALAVIFARKVIIPPTTRKEDVRILGSDDGTITLSRTMDSLTPGQYGLWFSGDTGHARVGEIRAVDEDRVVRQLLNVEFGDLASARRGRFSGWFYLGPGDLGYPFQDVEVPTPVGPAPAWLIPTEAGTSDDWVIMVHGRAVRRQECLRGVPTFREAGYTSLIVSYRNDGDAPNSYDHRYALGDREWQDVAAAIDYALGHGAERIVLMGYSMGGATVLQTVTRAANADAVRGVVLDSPVVDWVTALHFQGVVNRLPRIVQWATLQVLTRRWGRFVTGQEEAIDLERLDIVQRAGELRVPILLLHSNDDGYIPATASRALAAVRPDIVTYEEFSVARHTRLWNYDAPRWTQAIKRWLESLAD